MCLVVAAIGPRSIPNSDTGVYKDGRKEGQKEMFYLMTHSTHWLEQINVLTASLNNNDNPPKHIKEMFYLMMHSTHSIYGYVATDI